MLRGVGWQLDTEISGQHSGLIFKCQDGTPRTNYQNTPLNTPKSKGLNYTAVEARRPARKWSIYKLLCFAVSSFSKSKWPQKHFQPFLSLQNKRPSFAPIKFKADIGLLCRRKENKIYRREQSPWFMRLLNSTGPHLQDVTLRKTPGTSLRTQKPRSNKNWRFL